MKNDEVLLSIKNLKQYFNAGKKNEVRAIENISFEIYKGETLGLSYDISSLFSMQTKREWDRNR